MRPVWQLDCAAFDAGLLVACPPRGRCLCRSPLPSSDGRAHQSYCRL